MCLPLSGKHVLITRGSKEGENLAYQVRKQGGTPHLVPLIDFKAHHQPVFIPFLDQLETYDWLIFTSKNAVYYFFEELKERSSYRKETLQKLNIAVIGEKTKEYLQRVYGLSPAYVPEKFSAKHFASGFLMKNQKPKRVLIPMGNLAKDHIAESLESQEILVDRWIVYDTYLPEKSIDKLEAAIKDFLIDYAIFTAPSAFFHFIKAVKEKGLMTEAKKLKTAVIGPSTKKAVESMGYTVSVCPEVFTMDAMLQSLIHYVQLERNDEK